MSILVFVFFKNILQPLWEHHVFLAIQCISCIFLQNHIWNVFILRLLFKSPKYSLIFLKMAVCGILVLFFLVVNDIFYTWLCCHDVKELPFLPFWLYFCCAFVVPFSVPVPFCLNGYCTCFFFFLFKISIISVLSLFSSDNFFLFFLLKFQAC